MARQGADPQRRADPCFGLSKLIQSSLHGAAAAVMLRNVVASNNTFGLQAADNAILRVAHSVVTGNDVGVKVFGGGIIKSYGDNDIDGNGSDNTGVLTPLAMH
jgi:hypothetical protein